MPRGTDHPSLPRLPQKLATVYQISHGRLRRRRSRTFAEHTKSNIRRALTCRTFAENLAAYVGPLLWFRLGRTTQAFQQTYSKQLYKRVSELRPISEPSTAVQARTTKFVRPFLDSKSRARLNCGAKALYEGLSLPALQYMCRHFWHLPDELDRLFMSLQRAGSQLQYTARDLPRLDVMSRNGWRDIICLLRRRARDGDNRRWKFLWRQARSHTVARSHKVTRQGGHIIFSDSGSGDEQAITPRGPSD